MAETLGMLCDKLTIVKLKQFHSDDADRLASLAKQENQLKTEIDEFIANAVNGEIPAEKLTFAANKVYKKEGNELQNISGSIAEIFTLLIDTNYKLWCVQDKVYDFEAVPADAKNDVVKQLAILNLERNKCIDEIDKTLLSLVSAK